MSADVESDRTQPDEPPLTSMLRAAQESEGRGLREVLSIVYDRLRSLASASMPQTRSDQMLQTTVLANEAAVRLLASNAHRFNDQRHLFATASRIMRQVLVDHARARRRLKRGGDRRQVPLDAIVAVFEDRSGDLMAVEDTLARLEKIDERLVRLIELRFFLGLQMERAAALLGISTRTAEREWATGRAWLRKELSDGP